MNAFPLLAAIGANVLVQAIVWVIVAGLIFWLLSWLIGYAGVPEPFAKVARVLLAIVAVILLINAILVVAGRPFITF